MADYNYANYGYRDKYRPMPVSVDMTDRTTEKYRYEVHIEAETYDDLQAAIDRIYDQMKNTCVVRH